MAPSMCMMAAAALPSRGANCTLVRLAKWWLTYPWPLGSVNAGIGVVPLWRSTVEHAPSPGGRIVRLGPPCEHGFRGRRRRRARGLGREYPRDTVGGGARLRVRQRHRD